MFEPVSYTEIPRYKVYLVNFGYNLYGSFSNVEDALKEAQRVHFEASVIDTMTNEVVAGFKPIGGINHYRKGVQ